MYSSVSTVREILYVDICSVRIHFIMYLSFGYFRVVVYVNVRPCLCRQKLMYVKHGVFFDVLLTVHLSIILAINQLNAHILLL